MDNIPRKIRILKFIIEQGVVTLEDIRRYLRSRNHTDSIRATLYQVGTSHIKYGKIPYGVCMSIICGLSNRPIRSIGICLNFQSARFIKSYAGIAKALGPRLTEKTMEKRFLGIKELAEFLGITEGTMKNSLCVWVCHLVKVGRLVKFDIRKIEKWLEESSVGVYNQFL